MQTSSSHHPDVLAGCGTRGREAWGWAAGDLHLQTNAQTNCPQPAWAAPRDGTPQRRTKKEQQPLCLELEHRCCQKEEQTRKATPATSAPN